MTTTQLNWNLLQGSQPGFHNPNRGRLLRVSLSFSSSLSLSHPTFACSLLAFLARLLLSLSRLSLVFSLLLSSDFSLGSNSGSSSTHPSSLSLSHPTSSLSQRWLSDVALRIRRSRLEVASQVRPTTTTTTQLNWNLPQGSQPGFHNPNRGYPACIGSFGALFVPKLGS